MTSQAIQGEQYPGRRGDVQRRCGHGAPAGLVLLLLLPCGRCQRPFAICRSCYRGHRYCGPACVDATREESVRRARERHRHSPEGREDHADQERARRGRRREEGLRVQGSGGASPGIKVGPSGTG